MTELWVNKGCSKNLASKAKQKGLYLEETFWIVLGNTRPLFINHSGLKSQVLPKSKNLRVKAGSLVRLFVCDFYFEIVASSQSLSM